MGFTSRADGRNRMAASASLFFGCNAVLTPCRLSMCFVESFGPSENNAQAMYKAVILHADRFCQRHGLTVGQEEHIALTDMVGVFNLDVIFRRPPAQPDLV